jgi:hypothetical protein
VAFFLSFVLGSLFSPFYFCIFLSVSFFFVSLFLASVLSVSQFLFLQNEITVFWDVTPCSLVEGTNIRSNLLLQLLPWGWRQWTPPERCDSRSRGRHMQGASKLNVSWCVISFFLLISHLSLLLLSHISFSFLFVSISSLFPVVYAILRPTHLFLCLVNSLFLWLFVFFFIYILIFFCH